MTRADRPNEIISRQAIEKIIAGVLSVGTGSGRPWVRFDRFREENMAIHEMSFTRLLDAPADKLFRCWTTPELIKQWFAPRPWTVPVAQVDLTPGWASNITMRSPEG